jgi:hypothetical protein
MTKWKYVFVVVEIGENALVKKKVRWSDGAK